MEAKNIFKYTLGALIVLGFFIMGFLLLKSGKETDISLFIGALITAFATVVGYFFGSSLGSARKDETINTMLNEK